MRLAQVAIFVVVTFAVYAQTTTNNWDQRIISKKRHPLASFINPHVSPIKMLVIDGKRFERVRGLKKYYLQVPNANSIVFITDEEDYSVVYHIFNMDTDEDIAIHALDSMFGWDIGSDNSQDAVEKTENGIIVLCNFVKSANGTLPSLGNFESVRHFYYLDSSKKAIVAEKTLYYDKAGKVIYEHDATPPF